jgi:non-heme chloroperoxidase
MRSHPTPHVRRAALFAPLFLLACQAAAADPPVPLHPDDRSPHRAGRVEVSPGVRLEYLDWGGSGDPLVFIAGFGNTAHVFDELAPRLTDRHRVIGVTRRGFGGSDRPAGGYDTGTLAADLGAVLDGLGLERVTLVAHSIGGAEAQAFASAHPERVRGVVFLDSADFGCSSPPKLPTHLSSGRKLVGLFMSDPFNAPLPVEDRVSAQTEHAGRVRRLGWSPPLGELLAQRGEQPEGRRASEPEGGLFMAMRRGLQPCLSGLKVPALLVTVSEPETQWTAIGEGDQRIELSAEDRRFLQEDWAKQRQSVAARFLEQMPAGRVVGVRKAHHMIFLSHPDETLRAMRGFLAETN